MTFSWAQVDRLANACLEISASAADSKGFVTVRNLLGRFDANIVFRPLLVEAMLCEVLSQAQEIEAVSAPRWTLLVDSDKYPMSDDAVLNETPDAPLPERLRNTVAHELAHSLAFRAEEFGVTLVLDHNRNKKSREAEVQDIERHTERMSPLLLIPNTALNQHFSASTQTLTVQDVVRIRRSLGVSRHVLINRLNLLEKYAPNLLTRACLSNVAIGIGKWTSSGGFLLSGWPLYANFERNIIPAFLHSARQKKTMPISEILGDQSNELANRGATFLQVPAGVEKYPEVESLQIDLSMEKGTMGLAKHSFFLVTVRN